jgi:CRP/FNR family transcriptional regulator, cyclic AMP receptor protein
MTLIERFTGARGRRLYVETLAAQRLVSGNAELAEQLADHAEIIAIYAGQTLISQEAEDNDIYFILAGTFDVVVNGRRIAGRGPGDHVGEMAAVQPAQRRSATVIAVEEGIVAKLTEDAFASLGSRYPQIYRFIAQELARRLLQRNALVGTYRHKIRVFIISSTEVLSIARAVQNAFKHDDFTVVIWTDGVFRAGFYFLEALEAQVDDSDFAIAIAHGDDITQIRGNEWPVPRDNVIFELGLFMGRLGRARAILLEPRVHKIKLPSDLAGVTTITYSVSEQKSDMATTLGPACNELRDHINRFGPNNG